MSSECVELGAVPLEALPNEVAPVVSMLGREQSPEVLPAAELSEVERGTVALKAARIEPDEPEAASLLLESAVLPAQNEVRASENKFAPKARLDLLLLLLPKPRLSGRKPPGTLGPAVDAEVSAAGVGAAAVAEKGSEKLMCCCAWRDTEEAPAGIGGIEPSPSRGRKVSDSPADM
jgi:hypothetical protein